ncbi:unnamed protein product [Pipistrellus nathusii]|uniref:Uncharacterized protein n=1 Tax=Pipistrellus nathusii TaxID=59473 RepID=A0ABN9Z7V8_PIPNA
MELSDWVGLGAVYINACNFHNKQVHKELYSVQVITEPQSSRNFLLDIKKKFLLVKFLFFEAPCYLKNLCKIFVKFCFTRFYLKLFFARLLYFCMNVFFIGIT